ncbi:proline racemase family protein [Bacillus inaquosorum]|uniref:proline racemase family protein n=1 Tax=Bacillus inaquosorum TaxID=483913 RepID=UPI00228056D9|nr:proline racemase family protein [Bacillus inaquosorum]MCY8055947.1 proline racemase family protein [Bacillus inaquosorum]MCY9407454.1 proline racemase family protein [Bacillus inaquosorum]MCY9415810.1 proline racemase family protein [Bacillus inaquosorum]
MELLQSYIETIDAHTMGEAARIVVGGIPKIQGKSMMEKKHFMIARMDHIRKLLMHEPRGHLNMFGAILTEPCHSKCDLGVLFMDSGSYLNMCGHGTIASITIAINNGLIDRKDKVLLDTPSGIVECHVVYEKEKVKEVSFINVPAFLLEKDINVYVENIGYLTIDVAFGGSFFAIVDAEQLSLELNIEEQDKIATLGMAIRRAANEQLNIRHPDIPEINKIDLVEFSLELGKNHYKNAVVFGDGQIDRSPCGTGTCAKLSTLELKPGEYIIQESIIGSKFKGTVIDYTKVGDFRAIIPKITGAAWMTGIHKFSLEATDPYKEGFLLK